MQITPELMEREMRRVGKAVQRAARMNGDTRHETIPPVDVPEGAQGDWKVERFEVTPDEVAFHNLRVALNPQRGDRSIQAGTYTQLLHHGGIVMSDTPAERRDHLAPVRAAHGVILINGLGLGMVLNACLMKPEVTEAYVIEVSPDVCALVAPHYGMKFPGRVHIITADAFTWKPATGMRFGMCWHDVWPTICADNLPEMTKLKRKYGSRTDWQGCWGEDLCRAAKRQWNY